MTTNDDPDVRREATAHRAVDPLREALEAAIADTEADLIADADAEERIDLNFYEVSLPLETARSISAARAAAPQPATPGQRMIRAAEEATAIARGDAEPANVYPVPQPALADREVMERLLADLIKDRGYGVWDDTTFTEDVRMFADALIAAGLRLPGAVQPDETLAWAVVRKDETLDIHSLFAFEDKPDHETWHLPKDAMVVRVSIRRVEDDA